MIDTCLILAAGNQDRWNMRRTPRNMRVKQMIDIGGEALISRTIRQLNHRKCRPIMVTNNGSISGLSVTSFQPADCRRVIDTLSSTSEIWEGSVLVVLGDVCFSKSTMDLMTRGTEDFKIFGYFERPHIDPVLEYKPGWREIYALTFRPKEYNAVKRALKIVVSHTKAKKLKDFYNAYRMIKGIENDCVLDDSTFENITDYTQDFDWYPTYENFQKEVVDKKLLDDRRV